MPKHKIPPPIIALVFGLICWALNVYLPIYQPQTQWLFHLGYGFILLGLCLDLVSLMAFIKNKTTINPIKPQKATTLVVSGFYRFSRNPMYLGMFLILLGVALLLGDVSGLISLAFLLLTMNLLQIIPEEKILEELFGESYLDYKKKVRRWI